jgi:hypothetical protein
MMPSDLSVMLAQEGRKLGLTTYYRNCVPLWSYNAKLAELRNQLRALDAMTDNEADQAAAVVYERECRSVAIRNQKRAGYRRTLEARRAATEAGEVSEAARPLKLALIERCVKELEDFSDLPQPRRLSGEEYREGCRQPLLTRIEHIKRRIDEVTEQEKRLAQGQAILNEMAQAIATADSTAMPRCA